METDIKNNTEPTTEKVPEDKEEQSTLSKLGVYALSIVGISAIIGGLIFLTIKVWKYFFKGLEGTFFGDHIVLTIALIILLDIVGWVLYLVFRKD